MRCRPSIHGSLVRSRLVSSRLYRRLRAIPDLLYWMAAVLLLASLLLASLVVYTALRLEESVVAVLLAQIFLYVNPVTMAGGALTHLVIWFLLLPARPLPGRGIHLVTAGAYLAMAIAQTGLLFPSHITAEIARNTARLGFFFLSITQLVSAVTITSYLLASQSSRSSRSRQGTEADG